MNSKSSSLSISTSTLSIIMFVVTTEPSTSITASTVQWSQLCLHFEYDEILSATENFEESLVIGQGASAKVYKGNIKNGSFFGVAAIKRLDCMPDQGEPEFWAEVEMISRLRHCHLVSLIGYCNHHREMILVYEYMSNGTLADHLHKLATSLSWCQRLKICIGAARGLDYLHTGTGIEFGIIHRDIKSSNILLDETWTAKISDFGLFKLSPKNQLSSYVSTMIKGTYGYFDPNYYATGKLTRKSDVYAFGMVLLEVLCRKKAVDASLDVGLATWALDSIKEGHLKDIVDPHIKGEISRKCLRLYARIVERCLDNHPKNRPTMAEVVHSLEYVLTLQEKTNKLLQSRGKTLFARMIDKFCIINISQNSGMEDNQRNRKTDKVVVKGEKANPSKSRKRVIPSRNRIQKKSHPQPKSTHEINQKKSTKLPSAAPKPPVDKPNGEKKKNPKPEEIRKPILKTIGEENVEQDLKKSQVLTVKGTFEAPQLVDYFQKQTEKKPVIVKQDPEPKKEDNKGKEDKLNGAGKKKEEKKAEAVANGGGGGGGKGKEKVKDVGDESGEEERLCFRSSSDESGEEERLCFQSSSYESEKEVGHLVFRSSSDGSENDIKVVKPRMNEHHNYYKHYYIPLNYQLYPSIQTVDSSYLSPASLMFSDENPNACSVM